MALGRRAPALSPRCELPQNARLPREKYGDFYIIIVPASVRHRPRFFWRKTASTALQRGTGTIWRGERARGRPGCHGAPGPRCGASAAGRARQDGRRASVVVSGCPARNATGAPFTPSARAARPDWPPRETAYFWSRSAPKSVLRLPACCIVPIAREVARCSASLRESSASASAPRSLHLASIPPPSHIPCPPNPAISNNCRPTPHREPLSAISARVGGNHEHPLHSPPRHCLPNQT